MGKLTTDDHIIYVEKGLRTRRRALTPIEVERYRRRGLYLHRWFWFCTALIAVVVPETQHLIE